MNNIKSVSVLLSALSLSACITTQPPSYNNNISFEEYFSEYAVTKCEKVITLDNFIEVLNERSSDIYKNPFNQSCVPFRLQLNVPDAFIASIYESTNAKNTHVVSYTLYDWEYPKRKNAVALSNSNGVFFSALQFTDQPTLDSQIMRRVAGNSVLKYWTEIYFAHEIFHLSDFNYDKTVSQKFKEVVSDVSAILAVKAFYNLDEFTTLRMLKEKARFRKTEMNGRASSTHFDIELFNRALTHVEQLIHNEKSLPKFRTFKEIERYTLSFMRPIKRIHSDDVKYVYRIKHPSE